MKTLTLRQQEVLGYIQLHMRTYGTWPSFREIEDHFGFRSTNAVMGHLRALERKGHISRVPGQARTFRMTMELDEEARPENSIDVIDIPIYGHIAAGYPDGVEPAGEIGRLQIDIETAGLRRSRRSFALKVRGESMIDAGIFEGDTVIVEQAPPRHGDIVAALIDGETTLKRFINKPGEAPYLKAENKRYPELHPVNELVVQGVARAVVRNLG
ncbi:MAG: transcriptional repressor LexA [Verrucomicrobia bacterium]|nr:transcriptional repressor LexA [Verrucomicrobiota bacterium]